MIVIAKSGKRKVIQILIYWERAKIFFKKIRGNNNDFAATLHNKIKKISTAWLSCEKIKNDQF